MARVVTKRSYMDFVLTAALSLCIAIFLQPETLHAEVTYPLSYSGRLTLPGGEPMQGPVDIELRFWNAVISGAALSDPFPFAAVPLNQGVFQVRIPTTSDDVAAVFGDGSKTVFIEVTAKGVTYPRQEFSFVPLALRVPVDKGTVDFGTDGKLKVLVPARTSSDTVLSVDGQGKFTWEPLAVSNLQTKPVSQQLPTSGQVLTYDGSQWTPKTITQSGSAPVDLTTEVSGVLPIAKGGTGANLGSSGGAGQYLKQSTAGGAVTVGAIAASDITQSLGYSPVNRAGDTLGGSLSAGGFDITSTGNIHMAQSKTFGLSSNATDPTSGLTAADKGKTWFNSGSGQIKYWDGSSALALAVAGTGISSVTQGTGISVGAASGTATITLANTTVVPGSYSRANITVDAQGRLSGAVSGAAILDSDVAANAAIAQSKISGLTTALSAKEGLVATGTSSQYWRGDKSWQDLTTAAVAESGTSLYFNDARARGVLSATAPATYSLVSGAIGMTQSGAGSDGYLSSTDWNMFSAKQNALGYTPLNKSGDTLSGLLNAGGFDISNTGNIQLAAAKTLGFGVFGTDPTGLIASDKGKIWFNASTLQVKYWDGSSAVALGVSGSGLSSLNGQTGNTQTFAPPGTSGLAPAWSSAANAHTLNIPMASAASVTAGLLANTDYTEFANKIRNVTQGSGIAVATASGTATVSLATTGTVGTYALITTDAYGRVSSGTTLSASDIPPLNASAITSGMLPVANGGTGAATLATGNVILGNGTSTVQTVAPGISGNVLTSNGTTWQSLALPATNWAVPGTIGSSTPNSGDFTSITSSAQAGYKAKPFGGLTGNTGEVQFAELSANGTNYVGFKAPDVIGANKVWILPATDGSPGQVLKTDGAGNLGWSSDGGGTVTNVTATAPLAVSSGSSVPAISLSQANGSTNGYLTSTDWATFNTKQAGGNYVTALTGDVTTSGFSSGTATATLASVALGGTSTKVTYDVKGRVSSGTTLEAADLPPHGASLITSGAIAVANGGTGLTSVPGNGQIPIGNGTGYTLGNLSAGTGISISNAAGGVTVSSTVDTSTKVSKQGDTMTGGLSLPANGLVAGTNQLVLAGGNVGIGTTAPTSTLDVQKSFGGGMPATTGTSEPNAIMRLRSDGGATLDWGMIATGSAWIQPRYYTNLATNLNLLLNPNGGNVGIGTTNPMNPLDVNGTVRSLLGGFKFPDGTLQTTAALTPAVVTLTDASNIAVDGSLGSSFAVTIAGNRTMANPSNLVAGQTYTFKVMQDSTGGRQLSWGTSFLIRSASLDVDRTANAVSVFTFYSDGTKLYNVGGYGCTHGTQTFNYNGAMQVFTLPATACPVASVIVKIWGAGGGGRKQSPGGVGGGAAYATATFAAAPGSVFNVLVGGGGTGSTSDSPVAGGYGGGGSVIASGGQLGGGAAGGGRSEVSLGSSRVIAAGGGGAGYSNGNAANGGAGGGSSGATGTGSTPGSGGSQSLGGTGGSGAYGSGANGSADTGGNAGSFGGGGGGGYYGGGGGGSPGDGINGGGGGGSSYTGGANVSNSSTVGGTGATPANASDTQYTAGIGAGGTTAGTNGGNGMVILSY